MTANGGYDLALIKIPEEEIPKLIDYLTETTLKKPCYRFEDYYKE